MIPPPKTYEARLYLKGLELACAYIDLPNRDYLVGKFIKASRLIVPSPAFQLTACTRWRMGYYIHYGPYKEDL